jgi:hypothetical protein
MKKQSGGVVLPQRAKADFPNPQKPLSLEQTVKKILAEPEFAKFIHSHIQKSRQGDQEAANVVFAHYQPQPEELKALKLPRKLLDQKDVEDDTCTSTFMLIDFAAPAHIWSK